MNAAPARSEKQNDRQRGGHSCSSTGSASFGLRPHAGSGTRCGLVGVGGVFLGRPPFLPFSRTALALASEVARPPSRPSAWAALFGTGGLQLGGGRVGEALGDALPIVAVLVFGGRVIPGFREVVGLAVGGVRNADDGEALRHSVLDLPAEECVEEIGLGAREGDAAGFADLDFEFHLGSEFLVFVSGVSPSICRENTKPLRLRNRKVEKSFEREIPSGRRGCGAGENARQRHEGKTLNGEALTDSTKLTRANDPNMEPIMTRARETVTDQPEAARESEESSCPAPGSAHDALIVAFIQGAKWWEWESRSATMWQQDQQLAEREAQRRAKKGTLGRDALNDKSSDRP